MVGGDARGFGLRMALILPVLWLIQTASRGSLGKCNTQGLAQCRSLQYQGVCETDIVSRTAVSNEGSNACRLRVQGEIVGRLCQA